MVEMRAGQRKSTRRGAVCLGGGLCGSGGVLPEEQLLDAHAQEGGKVIEDGQIGTGEPSLPFGDCLRGYPQALGDLPLRQAATAAAEGDAMPQRAGMDHRRHILLFWIQNRKDPSPPEDSRAGSSRMCRTLLCDPWGQMFMGLRNSRALGASAAPSCGHDRGGARVTASDGILGMHDIASFLDSHSRECAPSRGRDMISHCCDEDSIAYFWGIVNQLVVDFCALRITFYDRHPSLAPPWLAPWLGDFCRVGLDNRRYL